MKRVISYQTSMITSDDVGVSFTPFRKTRDAELIASVFASEVERVLEQAKIKELHRDAIRNASVDGDACLYLYFDPEVETGGRKQRATSAASCWTTSTYISATPI